MNGENVRDKAEPQAEGAVGVVDYGAKELWYFAHPYTRQAIEGRVANFQICAIRAARLFSAGYCVFSPVCHTHPIELATPELAEEPLQSRWERWIKLDILIINRTNFTGLILAPGWEQSRGCCAEREEFLRLGKPIKMYEDLI